MNKRKKKRLAAKRENRLAKERIRLQPLIREIERIEKGPRLPRTFGGFEDSFLHVEQDMAALRADIYKKGVADFVRKYPELDSFVRFPDE